MRKISRNIVILLIMLFLWGISASSVFADVWEFGSGGSRQNPFTPRGYLVDTDSGQHWLSSRFNNSGTAIYYSGVKNGIDYLEAKKDDGSDYTFYAMTDRNPYPTSSDKIAYGKIFLFAYKDGVRISNFNDYVQTPATRGDKVDPSGNGTCWVFKIEGFELEPGCYYEFGFLRGMQANNGITLVLAEDDETTAAGYIQQKSNGLTAEERAKYNEDKNKEYEFISSWEKQADGKFKVNRVPMRFSVQTYADLSRWESAADKAQVFLDSVTESDLKEGKYVRENIKQLRILLETLNEKAEEEVKLLLQSSANTKIRAMIRELNAMLDIAKSEKPEPADISELEKKLKEAEELYAEASVNVGSDVGQYGRIEVENLKEEIDKAKEMDQYTPQNEINDQVDALEDAMIEVKASRVQKEQMVFYDKVTGIYVIAPVDSLPEDPRLFVRRMGTETGDYQAMKKNLSEKETEAVYYRIQFYQGDKKIQPTDQVEVQMPIVDEISEKSSVIYAVGDKGKLTRIESTKANGMQFLRTDHLTAFVMAGSTATPEEKAAARKERREQNGAGGSGSGQNTDGDQQADTKQSVMQQKDEKDAENKIDQLAKEKQKKEVYKDPINKLLKRSQNTATFSGDVQRDTDPIYLIIIAAVLAATAIALAIRGVLEYRRQRTI